MSLDFTDLQDPLIIQFLHGAELEVPEYAELENQIIAVLSKAVAVNDANFKAELFLEISNLAHSVSQNLLGFHGQNLPLYCMHSPDDECGVPEIRIQKKLVSSS